MKKKFTSGFIILALLLVNISQLFSQGTPCGDSGDPDVPSDCPLDTWVLILVAVFLCYATLKLYKAKQPQTNLTN